MSVGIVPHLSDFDDLHRIGVSRLADLLADREHHQVTRDHRTAPHQLVLRGLQHDAPVLGALAEILRVYAGGSA
jgi:hypothetical protein